MTQYHPAPATGYSMPPTPKKGIGIAAMVLGIVAIALSFIPIIGFLSFVTGPIAVILGIVAIIKNNGRGAGIAGLITGAFGFIIVLIGTLLFGAFLSVLDDEVQQDEDAINEVEDTQEEQSEAAETMEEEGEEPEAAEADGDAGSRTNPLALGETVSNGTWEVTINEVTLNADDEVSAENEFNEPAPEGSSYALVNISVTYLGDDSGVPLTDVDIANVAGSGETSAWYDALVVAPNEFDSATELYEGGTEEGNVALVVPDDDDEGTLRVRLGLFAPEDYFYEMQ